MEKRLTLLLAALLLALATSCSSLLFWRSGEETPEDPGAAEFSLHANYGSHMVLQQGRPIPVSGKGTPGGRVKVTLGNASAEATVDRHGEWRALLPAMRGGMEPLTLTVAGAQGVPPVVCEDVLVGEVWFCGGQSNMEMPLWTGEKGWTNTDGDKVAAAGMETPTIRLFNAALQKYADSYALAEEPRGEWTLPTEANLKRFSAVAYFFGQELTRRLNVPVGLIESCWGGTRIEPWLSERAYREGGDEFRDIYKELKALDPKNHPPTFREQQAAWNSEVLAMGEQTYAAARRWAEPGYRTIGANGWEIQRKTAGELIPGRAKDRSGFFWYVTYVEIPEGWAGKEAMLDFSFMDDCDTTFFNGVQVGATGYDKTQWPASTRRRYRIPAALVKPGKAKIAVRVLNILGFGGICRDRLLVCGQETIRLDGEWFTRTEGLLDLSGKPLPTEVTTPSTRQYPAALFNTMVYPWTRYPVRGVIWYQGESNAGAHERYATLFQMMAKDWRDHWRQDYLDKRTLQGIPPMPFIYCQLSSHKPGTKWPPFRQMQQELLKADPYFGMAVTMDHGDPETIHPPEKKPVGVRLAAEAMRLCYGSKAISSGPVPVRCTPDGDRLVVEFGNCGLGLVSTDGKPLAAFEVAGADGRFVPAKAEIRGSTVVLSAENMLSPTRARYAWKPYCEEMNLGNRDGFPAGPFDTETLPAE